jgi:segregation and condensation protein B
MRDLPIDPDDEAPTDSALESTDDGDEPDTEHLASAETADAENTDTATDADAPSASPESDEPGSDTSPLADHPIATADEAANPAAEVEPDTAEQDTEEYRA